MEILKYIIKRILAAIPILFIVSVISFFIIRLSPIDPIGELRLNPAISQETLNLEIQRLGLDKPVAVQYFYWLKSFIHGDLGVSTSGESVASRLWERVPNTLLLSLVVIIFTWAIAIPLGIVAAVNRNKFIDKFITAVIVEETTKIYFGKEIFLIKSPLASIVCIPWLVHSVKKLQIVVPVRR